MVIREQKGGGLWFVANKITRSFETRKIPKQKNKKKRKEALHNGRGPSRRSKQCKSQKKSVEGGEQLRE